MPIQKKFLLLFVLDIKKYKSLAIWDSFLRIIHGYRTTKDECTKFTLSIDCFTQKHLENLVRFVINIRLYYNSYNISCFVKLATMYQWTKIHRSLVLVMLYFRIPLLYKDFDFESNLVFDISCKLTRNSTLSFLILTFSSH